MCREGILGSPRSERITAAGSQRKQHLRRRDVWLVILGAILHAVYMLSIFDIYFKSPIVHGIDPVTPQMPAPARRLILIIADGLRADKFFESDSDGKFRAPFLRNIMKTKGRWGVSHARPPTESRPGHVAIIAGFYEDPSAVTKGWKANPVEFDSVFNRSQHTFAFGSPDIVPIFCSDLPHCTWTSYPHHFEDFASDASFLDQWSFDQFHTLLNASGVDAKLKELLAEEKIVVFLHLLGCDTNGHAHRPYSPIYLNNVKVVDSIVERVYNLVEVYFNDNQTAYIFTADHGMSDKGSHGDGHPTNTDTPLVAWGAGIRGPSWSSYADPFDDGFRFVDEHGHDMHTPSEWSLDNLERVDVNQADIAPLMATLLGLPSPVHSVGSLPVNYMSLNKAEEIEAALTNAKQILNQFLQKSYLKQSNSLYFKPFKALANHSSILSQIDELVNGGHIEAVMKLTVDLRNLALAGLQYFQTYDWFMLMTTVTLGYIGWIVCLVFHVLKFYTSLVDNACMKYRTAYAERNNRKVYICGALLLIMLSFILFVQHSPFLYYIYVAMTIYLWMELSCDAHIFKVIWRSISGSNFFSVVKLLIMCAISLFIIEFLVISFSNRKLYTWYFIFWGLLSSSFIIYSAQGQLVEAIFTLATCWFLSSFTLLTAEIPDQTSLVLASGLIIIVIGIIGNWFGTRLTRSKYWGCVLNYVKSNSRFSMLIHLQVGLVGLSSMMVWLTTSQRTHKQKLLFTHQLINWSLSGLSMLLPLFSSTSLFHRLLSIYLGFAPPFLLLSVGYEALFYSALYLALMAWILSERAFLKFENKSVASPFDDASSTSSGSYLHLSDIRVPLIFMVFFNVAFFGTGNFASIASFEISSVYRFITIFNPFLMSALLIFKLLIPFFIVMCVFSALTQLIRIPLFGCYFLVILLSDIMTVHFFFLVRNTGSWMEIGNSISHFGIMSAQVIFVLLLLALTSIYTRDIQVGVPRVLFRKEF